MGYPRKQVTPVTNKTGNGHSVDEHLPSAVVSKSRLSWMLWLIPIGAAALCVWFVYRDYVAAGPLLTIYFQDVEGLEVENTPVQYRGAIVGQVKSITIDGNRVKVRARLASSARNLAREGSTFWIVRPEVKIGSISGLRTIISGEYINVEPGAGAATNTFVGAEKAPLPAEPNSLEIVLLSATLSSLQEQSPIFYRGVQVGEVTYYQLSSDSRQVIVHARIWQQYAPLVRPESKFWNAGGLDMRLGLFKGLQISAESPATILSGGIEFATPPAFSAPATNGATFTLYDKAEEKWQAWTSSIPLQLPPQAATTNVSNTVKDLESNEPRILQ